MPTLELFSHRLPSESMFRKKAEQRIRVTLELFKAHAQDQHLVSDYLVDSNIAVSRPRRRRWREFVSGGPYFEYPLRP